MRKICIRSTKDVFFEDCEVPNINSDEILVSALITGISAGTERMWYNGTNPAIKKGRRGYPYYPGYEYVGRVEKVGEKIKRVSLGDHVIAMAPHAEKMVLGPSAAWEKIPKGTKLESALAIPLTMTAIHTAHQAGISLGDSVGIIGLGMVGLLMVRVARLAGAQRVIAINRSGWKLDYAVKMGADLAIQQDAKDLQQRVLDETQGRGVDIAIECSGTPQGCETATAIVRRRGMVVVEGFHTGSFDVSGEDLFIKELEIKGVRAGGGPDYSYEYVRWSKTANFGLACDLVFQGKLNLPDIVTHRFMMSEIMQAYEMIDNNSEPYIQVVLDWRGGAKR